MQRGRPVNVQGQRGYFADATASADEVDKVPNKHQVPTLAWEFAPNQWVTVQGWDPAASPQMRKLHLDALTVVPMAAAIGTTVSAPLLLPYRVGYLPSGLSRGGGRETWSDSSWDSYLWFRGSDELDTNPILMISASPRRAGTQSKIDGSLTINGHPATFTTGGPPTSGAATGQWIQPGVSPQVHTGPPPANLAIVEQLTVDFGSAVISIESDSHHYSDDELVQIAKSITLASNVNDRSTWFDASK